MAATHKTKTLTPAKKKFAQEYAKTDNGTQSVLKAYPTIKPTSARVKSTRLLTNDSVLKEIDIQKASLQKIATKAIYRLDQLVNSNDEQVGLRASTYVIDRTHGKLDQQAGTHIESITINLGTLPIPEQTHSDTIVDVDSQ